MCLNVHNLLLVRSLLLSFHKLNLLFILDNNVLFANDSFIVIINVVFCYILRFVYLFAGFLPVSYTAEQYLDLQIAIAGFAKMRAVGQLIL